MGLAMKTAIAYYRTSSNTNVADPLRANDDRDSRRRQSDACIRFAKQSGFLIEEEFYDAGVKGSDALEDREGFSALLDYIEAEGVRTVIVEDASRLARTLMVQELGIIMLMKRGVKVYASNGDDLTDTADEMKNAFRQIAGVFAELEKKRLVKKLKAARDRKKLSGAKCEGRKSHMQKTPEMCKAAFTEFMRGESFAKIAQTLEAQGYGKYAPMSVYRMVQQYKNAGA